MGCVNTDLLETREFRKHLSKKILQDLKSSGISYGRISMRTGLAQSSLHKLVSLDRAPSMRSTFLLAKYYTKVFSEQQLGSVNFYYQTHKKEVSERLSLLIKILKEQ
jgi:hypothetical protein